MRFARGDVKGHIDVLTPGLSQPISATISATSGRPDGIRHGRSRLGSGRKKSISKKNRNCLVIPLRQDAGGFCEDKDAAPQRILSSLPSDAKKAAADIVEYRVTQGWTCLSFFAVNRSASHRFGFWHPKCR